MKLGYPTVIIDVESKGRYCDALDKGHMSGDYHDFIKFIAEKTEEALRFYLMIIRQNTEERK